MLLDGMKLSRDSVLYVGSDKLLDKNTTVRKWLSENIVDKTGHKKEMIAKALEDAGLADKADARLSTLKYSQKMLTLLAAAAYISLPVIVINDPAFEIDEEEDMAARRVFMALAEAGKTVLLAGSCPRLMQSVASHVIALNKGNCVFNGSFRDFVNDYCGSLVTFASDDAQALAEALAADGRFDVSAEGDTVTLARKPGTEVSLSDATEAAIAAGVPSDSIRSCERGFAVACKEVYRR